MAIRSEKNPSTVHFAFVSLVRVFGMRLDKARRRGSQNDRVDSRSVMSKVQIRIRRVGFTWGRCDLQEELFAFSRRGRGRHVFFLVAFMVGIESDCCCIRLFLSPLPSHVLSAHYMTGRRGEGKRRRGDKPMIKGGAEVPMFSSRVAWELNSSLNFELHDELRACTTPTKSGHMSFVVRRRHPTLQLMHLKALLDFVHGMLFSFCNVLHFQNPMTATRRTTDRTKYSHSHTET